MSKIIPEECSICIEYGSEDMEWTILRCKHVFHQDCLKLWFKEKKSCPVCRKEICTPRPREPATDIIIPIHQNYVVVERVGFCSEPYLRSMVCTLCALLCVVGFSGMCISLIPR